jgi:excisionase family DNA binding protein
MEEETFTPGQVARRLRLNYFTVLRWIHTGVLEAETVEQGKRNRYLIKKSVVEALENDRTDHTS